MKADIVFCNHREISPQSPLWEPYMHSYLNNLYSFGANGIKTPIVIDDFIEHYSVSPRAKELSTQSGLSHESRLVFYYFILLHIGCHLFKYRANQKGGEERKRAGAETE